MLKIEALPVGGTPNLEKRSYGLLGVLSALGHWQYSLDV